ncbi:hypothetical protein PVAP13_4NG107319 [Panicum virgatum]|uniref:Uncharacterized protein n=1 Tax=Panicum virgatum TaxID=38727 RepID=A0A8T0T6F4_PANVG|nr:hypothetical protein PVAP13_4NG107319 [Panicum virgatum]
MPPPPPAHLTSAHPASVFNSAATSPRVASSPAAAGAREGPRAGVCDSGRPAAARSEGARLLYGGFEVSLELLL